MSQHAANEQDVPADQPLDAKDGHVLARMALMYDRMDPVPSDLVERLQFALTLDALKAELAELQLMPAEAMARSAGTDAVKTLTFTSDTITTMITIAADGPDRVRIDGWAAPGGGVTVELRQVATKMHTQADADGRFVFDDVPHGMTRFVVRAAGGDDLRQPVITPAVEL
ncbi:MAG: hypothetical protein JWN95_1174 [Frankiales bacterium]|nr:hypothetical protein [Frankiales bacterium]